MSELRLNKSMGWYARTAVRNRRKKGGTGCRDEFTLEVPIGITV